MTTPRSPFRRHAPGALVRAQDDGAVELLLYDEIGYWGIRAKEFAEVLAGIDAETIHLRVNSPGGDVFDGVAIFNSLRQHGAQIVTHVDGLAASIASVIALAGDEVRMAPNAFFMIHNPWSITLGNAKEHRKVADTLDKIAAGALLSTYQAKTGLDAETLETWMDEETWLDAEESREAGFADVVEEAAPADARAVLPFDLGAFARVPDGLRWQAPADGLTPEDLRELEAVLRDEGLSRKEAAAAVSGLKKWRQRDAGASSSTPPGSRDGAGADHGRAEPLHAANALAARMLAGALRRGGARG
jgi:ATP-dependent protease ClpP protease subunit